MDFETVDLDAQNIEVNFTKSDYAQVLFHNIAETYPIDAHIECRYTITPTLAPTSRDWVGLYRVGWRSSSDHVIYEWSPMPENYEVGQTAENHILFQCHRLPKDDGEFYQFCYVTRSGHVRGASTPFQFKKPTIDELVEVEDEDGEMLVIKTRTAILKEDLQKATTEKSDLVKGMHLLEKERDSLLCKLIDLDKKLVTERDDKEAAQHRLNSEIERVESLTREATDMETLHDGLRDKLNVLNQEKESILKRLDENDAYIKGLQDKIKALINDKDALSGKNKALEEEKELFKTHFTSSETTMQGYVQEVDRLKLDILDSEKNASKLRNEIETTKKELSNGRKKLERQSSVSKADKNHIQDLTERLRNCEDKLTAAEHIKQLLNEEVMTLQQAYGKMSADLEVSQSEVHKLKSQLSKSEEKGKQEAELLDVEINTLQSCIDTKESEAEVFKTEIASLKDQVKMLADSKLEEQEGPLYALHTAQQNLKERYSKMKKMCEEQKKQLEELLNRQKRAQALEVEYNQEIKDLKERLLMGQEEYKNKFIECQKLQRELRKSKRSSLSASSSVEKEVLQTSSSSSSSEQSSPCKTAENTREEEIQTVVDTREAAAMTSDVADLTCTELQDQLNDLGRELEHRNNKKHKYKQLYMDEKDKNGFLQRHYFDELKQKDDEITKLKLQLQDTNEEYSLRVAKLQSLVEQKEREIEALQANTASADAVEQYYPPQAQFPNPYAGYVPAHGQYPPQASPIEPCAMAIPRTAPAVTAQPTVKTKVLSPYKESSPPRSPSSAKPDVSALDPLNNEDVPPTLEAPLRPLPAPMMPERLPSAKLAAIRQAALMLPTEPTGLADLLDIPEPGASGASGETHSPAVEAGDGPSAPPLHERGDSVAEFVDAEEEKFMDAQGEPQRFCPVCSMIFDEKESEQKLIDHVNAHYGPICPVCSVQFEPNYCTEKFQEHVQSHFQDE